MCAGEACSGVCAGEACSDPGTGDQGQPTDRRLCLEYPFLDSSSIDTERCRIPQSRYETRRQALRAYLRNRSDPRGRMMTALYHRQNFVALKMYVCAGEELRSAFPHPKTSVRDVRCPPEMKSLSVSGSRKSKPAHCLTQEMWAGAEAHRSKLDCNFWSADFGLVRVDWNASGPREDCESNERKELWLPILRSGLDTCLASPGASLFLCSPLSESPAHTTCKSIHGRGTPTRSSWHMHIHVLPTRAFSSSTMHRGGAANILQEHARSIGSNAYRTVFAHETMHHGTIPCSLPVQPARDMGLMIFTVVS